MATEKDVYADAIDGHRVYGTLYKAEQPHAAALLIHGITADRAEWGFYDLLAPALQQAGLTALAIDWRGHGKSSLTPDRLTLSGILLDISAGFKILEEQAGGVPKLVVGNSFGGGLVYLAGMAREQVSHIFLTAPVLSYITDIGNAAAVWPGSGSTKTFPYGNYALSEFLVPEMKYFDEEIERLVPVKPFTIVHGSKDSDVLFSLSENFVKKRAMASLVGLSGMDHCWAKPGDAPPFKDPDTIENRKIAVKTLLDLMIKSVPSKMR